MATGELHKDAKRKRVSHRVSKVRRVGTISRAGCEGRQVRRRRHAGSVRRSGAADAIVEAVEQPLRLHILAARHSCRQQRGPINHLVRDSDVLLEVRAALAIPRHDSAAGTR